MAFSDSIRHLKERVFGVWLNTVEDDLRWLEEGIQARTDAGLDCFGVPFAPRKDAAGRWLWETGALRDVLIEPRAEGSWSMRVADGRLQVHDYHMKGTSKMPARMWFGPDDEQRAQMTDRRARRLEAVGSNDRTVTRIDVLKA